MRVRMVALATVVIASLVATLPASGQPRQHGQPAPLGQPALEVQAWASGISDPWDLAFLPDGAALVTEKTTGVVHLATADGTLSPIAADQRDFRAAGEGGLMGIAVDPSFATNGRYYTCQNSTSNDVRVVRWKLDRAAMTATRQKVLVDGIPMTSGRHSGCRLAFGPEGYLWVATGDAAVGTAPQSLSSLGGKVLRISAKTGNGPKSNPFFTTKSANRSKIFSYGHRNLQGLGRRPCTDQMWTGEHGPGTDDEINLIRAGANYGWNPVPGYNENVPMTDLALGGNVVRAKWRSGAPTVALSGIGWIQGASWRGWDGELAGATLKNAELMVFEFSGKAKLTDVDTPRAFQGSFGRLRVPVLGSDGALYVASQSNGTVYRAAPPSVATPGTYDLNGDGFDDLVVGVPGDDVRGNKDAGSFVVVYGTADGLGARKKGERRTQASMLGEQVGGGDQTGGAIAVGDVNGDGTSDAVVGAPGESISGRSGAGAFHAICGRSSGVDRRSSQTFSSAGSVAGKAEGGDRLGSAAATGDFNGDGFDDVAASAPGENRGKGAVTVLPGSRGGLVTSGSKQLTAEGSRRGDAFGHAVVAGDFDGDGRDELAVGAPQAGSGRNGQVSVFAGRARGLAATPQQILGAQAAGPAAAHFGAALVTGRFNNDQFDDLVVLAQDGNGAAVTVFYGGTNGLDTSEVLTVADTGDVGLSGAVGGSLGAGDIDGDGIDELMLGAPNANSTRGAVAVFDRSESGPTTSTWFSQHGSVPGSAQVGALFGASLRVADFDGDGFGDVAVGAPGTRVKGKKGAGAVVVLAGSATGLSPNDTASRRITLATPGVPGKPGAGDGFATAL